MNEKTAILAKIFLKKAQDFQIKIPQLLDNDKKQIYTNHVIRITKEADKLIKAIKDSLPFKTIKQEALNYAQNIKADSINLHNLTNKTDVPDQTQLDFIFDKLMSNYNILEKTYIDKKFESMKLIKESLYYIGNKNI